MYFCRSSYFHYLLTSPGCLSVAVKSLCRRRYAAALVRLPSDIGALLPLWSVLPFAGILLSIALMPLWTPHFWHHHFAESFRILGAGFCRAFSYLL